MRAEVRDPLPPAPAAAPEFPPYDLPGYGEVHGTATGFFYTEQHDAAWWLIDPNGLGFYALGVDHVNYNAHWCQALGDAPHHRNVEAKYGSEANWAAAAAERLHDWGFNTLSAGHSPHLRHTHFAHTEWLGAGRSFVDIENIVPRTTWTGFPNVFSPRWERHCDLVARRICAPNRDDPWLLGYFLDNELQWFGPLDDWRNEFGLFTETWRKPPEHTAKRAWMGVVREECPAIERFNAAWGTDFASFDDLAASTDPVAPPSDAARDVALAYARLVAERYFRTGRKPSAATIRTTWCSAVGSPAGRPASGTSQGSTATSFPSTATRASTSTAACPAALSTNTASSTSGRAVR